MLGLVELEYECAALWMTCSVRNIQIRLIMAFSNMGNWTYHRSDENKVRITSNQRRDETRRDEARRDEKNKIRSGKIRFE